MTHLTRLVNAHVSDHRGDPRRALACTAFAAFIAVVLSAPSVDGSHTMHPLSGPYSRNPCSDSSNVDPVGVQFEGDEAGANGSIASIYYHAGWTDDSGSDQYLRVLTDLGHGTYDCRPFGEQGADGGSSDTRRHLRIWRSPWYPPPGSDTFRSAGTPHREYHDCGSHQIFDENSVGESGYDTARQNLKAIFNLTNAHDVETDYWHNDNARWTNCNDYSFSSTGYGITIQINHDHST